MLAPYRSVLSAPGARAFTAAGLLARLPISTVTLGIVLLVVERTGSYGLAGSVSAAYVVTSAVASPLLARLTDRWSQAAVLIPCMLGFAAGLSLLVLSVERGWPTPVPHLFAVLGGMLFPPIEGCIRARWSLLLGDGPRLQTAFALEAVIDETVFILGPVLVTVLATRVNEAVALFTVVGLAVLGGLRLAGLTATAPRPRPHRTGDPPRVPLGAMWLVPIVAAAVCLGVLFGSSEVATVAFAEERGEPAAVGALLALWATGSLIAGFITGAVQWRADTLTRYRAGALALAVSMFPLPFIDSLVVLGLVLFLGGFAISPTLVAVVSLVAANVPASRLTEGITWSVTGLSLGIAPGAALSGYLVDRYGASTAYWVPAVGGLLAVAIAMSTGTRPVTTSVQT